MGTAEQRRMGMMIDNPELFQMIVQKHALKLEIYGMKRRGRSAYALIKEMYGLKGSKLKVLDQVNQMIHSIKKGEINE